MRRFLQFAVSSFLIAILALAWLSRTQTPAQVKARVVAEPLVLLAAPGRVEGKGETISLGAGADGIVKAVLVTDGDAVTKGDLLAVIRCEEVKAEIDRARAVAESARQTRIRVLRGPRDEERKAAAGKAAAAQAVAAQAQEHLRRLDALYEKAEISRESFEQAQRDYEVARANYESARAEEELEESGPLPEEKTRADADLLAAEQNVSIATEKLERCNVRAPISGTVLRVMTRVGESYSTVVPRPLFTLVDDSIHRVRAEVDEEDVGKVKLGQRATITADGFPDRQFGGRVIQLGHVMGRKSVLSGDPAEKADRDILEVIIELQSGKELPVGLRVTAQFFSQ
jgi:HlyD family secretion protein